MTGSMPLHLGVAKEWVFIVEACGGGRSEFGASTPPSLGGLVLLVKTMICLDGSDNGGVMSVASSLEALSWRYDPG